MQPARRVTVGIALPPPLSDEVTAYVESEAGWQAVGPDGPPTPLLVVAGEVQPGRPTVVVRESGVDAAVVRQALDAGALDVLAWPDERERLLSAPQRVQAGAPHRPVPTLRVGGVAGGVGTSTVALALGGLLAWSGRRTIVVGGDDLTVHAGVAAWSGPGAGEIAALPVDEAAGEVGELAVVVAGAGGLRLLGGPSAPATLPTAGWPADAVVVDARADGPADLLVAWPDGRLVAGRHRREPVVLVGDRPLSLKAAGQLLGRRPVAVLPWSARVAEAALAGRVPAGLPGAWLRRLRPVLGAVAGTAAQRAGRPA